MLPESSTSSFDRKDLNLSFKAGIQLQNKNHTEDWALGCHPRDNCHVNSLT